MKEIRLYLMILGFMLLLQNIASGQVVLRDSVTIVALHSDVRESVKKDVKKAAELDSRVLTWLNKFNKDVILNKRNVNNDIFNINQVVSGFEMPRDVRLIVFYSFLSRLDTAQPPFASLITNFVSQGDSMVSEALGPRFPNLLSGPTFILNGCTSSFETHQQFNYDNFGEPDSVFQQSFGEVSQGDTIQFFYDTDFGFGRDTLAISISNEITLSNGLIAGWDVTLGSFDFCLSRFLDKLDIFVGVVTDSFEITISDPDSIWPTLPAGQGGNPNARNLKDTTTVELIQNGIRIPNRDVTISASMILPSGGHDHTIQPLQDSLGVFTIYGANPDTASGTITARTDANGRIQFGYRAPVFGGEVEFVAMTISEGDTLVARDTLLVKVPGLELLEDGTNYTKIGGTANHNGPPGFAEDHNHYGTNATVLAMDLIAGAYRDSLPNEQILHINDISLPNGGLFDVNGNWLPEHSSHRTGEDVDVRTELPGTRQGVPVRIPRNATNWQTTTLVRNRIFERRSNNSNAVADIHNANTIAEHYHLDLGIRIPF